MRAISELFSMLGYSFWSPAAYYRALALWRFRFLGYFALLAALAFFITYAQVASAIAKIFDDNAPSMVSQIGEIEIKDGNLKTRGGETAFVKAADGSTAFVLSEKYLEPAETQGALFSVEKDKVFYRIPDIQEGALPLKDFGFEGKFGRDGLLEIADVIKTATLACFAVSVCLVVVLSNALYTFIISLAVFIMSRTFSPKMGYARCLKFSIILITPVTLIGAAVSFFGHSQILTFIYAAVTVGLGCHIMKRMPSEFE